MSRRPEFYPRCRVAGHAVTVADNGLPCGACWAESTAHLTAPQPVDTTHLIDGLGGPFLLPGEPANTRDHAIQIVTGVWDGEYEADGLPSEMSGATVLDIGAHLGGFARWAQTKWGKEIGRAHV